MSGNAALIVLILVNLIPILGVLAWDWNAFEIVVLYWFENVVIGMVCVLKMLTATGEEAATIVSEDPEDPSKPRYLRKPVAAPSSPGLGGRIFLTGFFIFHYGMFCFGHGIFVFMLLDGKLGGFIQGGPFALIARKLPEAFASGGKWFALGIVASHLYSFFHDYLGKGEFRRTSIRTQMSAPYGRIIVLHIAILFGAFVITALGSPIFLLILLIVGKIVLELKLQAAAKKKLRSN